MLHMPNILLLPALLLSLTACGFSDVGLMVAASDGDTNAVQNWLDARRRCERNK